MTLIVGKIKNNKIRFFSDSKITDENSVRNNALSGNLKLYIINPVTCIGFAGNVYFAEKFLSELYSNKLRSFSQLVERCLKLNIESDNKTVFCIGLLNQNASPQLFKIDNNKIEVSRTDIWIGEKLGFEKYQESYHSYDSKEDDFLKMEKAFNEVIKDEKIPTVSDFQISVETEFSLENNIGFLYGLKAKMHFGQQSFTISGEDRIKEIPITFGGADIGASGITYLRSFSFLQPAIAIHFPQGEFGVLFYPMINQNKPIIITNQPDGEDFANEVLKIYGIRLQGMVAKDGHAIKYIITGK